MDLFTHNLQKKIEQEGPLAIRLRPSCLEEFVGQEELLAKGQPLRCAIEEDQLPSCLFYGPPGTGKTTLAQIIASFTSSYFEQLNAVSATVKDVRTLIRQAQERWTGEGRRTILFMDEIHRFNKAQQDALLASIEEGILLFIGATTENPFFHLTSPLLSRLRIFIFQPLNQKHLQKLLKRALQDEEKGLGKKGLEVSTEALKLLCQKAGGDARWALNSLEMAIQTVSINETGTKQVTADVIKNVLPTKVFSYDQAGDNHYDIVSAFIKSIRGSDPDAALFWLARMIQGGEDPFFIARRLIISASEDVGNADPRALEIANAAAQGLKLVGMPEGKIILAQATTYLASSPKSNASYQAINEAMKAAEKHAASQVPKHLKDSSYKGSIRLGHGKNYQYPHLSSNGFVLQRYLPIELQDKVFYRPKEIGLESRIKAHLNKLHPRRNTEEF